jgi:hypothetical protein
MCTKKEIIIFAAGAEAFHTFAHLVFFGYGISFKLPWMTVTPKWNLAAFLINLLITVCLLYWASKLKN